MANTRRILCDPAEIRAAIHRRVIEAVRSKFPIESNNYRAELVDTTVRTSDPTTADVSDTEGGLGNISDGVLADIDIFDKNGTKVGSLRKHRILNIPYYTNRWTMLLDGHEYSIVSQMRTKSGVYTRKRGNDELEASFNLAKGANFKLVMDPETGVFKVDILGATIPASAVLKILGAAPSDISSAIGEELYAKNSGVSTTALERTRNTLWSKLVNYKRSGEDDDSIDRHSADEKDAAIRAYFSGTSIDPETTEITLGKSFSSVSPQSIIAAMKRMLEVYRGDGDIDERDNLEFQKIHSVEDLLNEVITKASGIVPHIKSKLDAFRPSGDAAADKKALKNAFSPVYFTKPLQQFITGSSLSRMPSQINPIEFVDAASIITRLGEGGIGSERAVPFDTRNVHTSYLGTIDPIAAPESFKVGIDVHCTMGARKGDDNEFYKNVINCATGKEEDVRIIDLHNKHLGFPDPSHLKTKKPDDIVASVYRGKIVKVKRSELDYQIPSPHDMSTYTSNTIPFMNANQGNRLLMGDKHIQQSLPLADAEPRLVYSAIRGTSVEKALAGLLSQKSPVDGVVTDITDSEIVITGDDGSKHRIGYYTNFALATKTFLHDDVLVHKGDKVRSGQPLTGNNFTKGGTMTMGRNLTVAYMPYLGLNHEDGVVISESTSRKMTSVHADKFTLHIDGTITTGKKKYVAAYPVQFTSEQLAKLDDDGVVRKGEKIVAGDPVILAMSDASESRQNQVLGMLHKSLIHPYTDISEVYEEEFEGEVVGVTKTASVITVVVKVLKHLKIGDKIAGSYGNKGVCSRILPDDQMPRDADGNPVDCVLTSASVISRVNPAQILESTLGKIAKKKGIRYDIENFSHNDYVGFVRGEMRKYGISDKETVTDPVTGKRISGVFVGVQHMHKLFKTSDTNFAGRGVEGAYDLDDSPSGSGFEGPKAFGGMEVNALIAHNARSVLRESTMLRGSKNSDFWKAFHKGLNPNFPVEKKTFTRFGAILRQAGINLERRGDEIIASPLTDADILKSSSGEVRDGKMLFAKTMQPESGGLFDNAITGGLKGTKWSHIKLVEPVVNPVFAEAARSVLGMTGKEFKDASIRLGGAEIKRRLNAVDIKSELKQTEDDLNSGKLVKSELDTKVKRVGYLRALSETGMKAGDAYVLSVVPVTPPIVRPIVVGRTGDTMDNDANKLYSNLILQNNVFRKVVAAGLGEGDIQENRKALADRLGELAGMLAPQDIALRNRGVKGALDFIAGDVPKTGYFQRKVIYGKMNLTGRSTITPDITLGMDDVGLPEKVAWSMYRPFIIRRMSQMGYNPLQARDAVDKRSDVAKRALDEEMASRPVIINRAPTLWRHGILAANPRIVSDTNLHVNSLWERSLNADYDGDAMQIHLPVTDDAVSDAKRMLPSQQVFTDQRKGDLLEMPTKEPLIGLYKATENVGRPVTGAVHHYADVGEAWKAYYAGKLKMTDLVEIG